MQSGLSVIVSVIHHLADYHPCAWADSQMASLKPDVSCYMSTCT